MSLACRFYVVFMSFMLILRDILLLDIQSFTALFMSYVIKYGHFSFQIPILELGCISFTFAPTEQEWYKCEGNLNGTMFHTRGSL